MNRHFERCLAVTLDASLWLGLCLLPLLCGVAHSQELTPGTVGPAAEHQVEHQVAPASLSKTERYNQGVTLYRDERFEESAQAFREAASASDRTVASRARFNLGNACYARALTTLDADPQSDADPPGDSVQAIEWLRSAIEHYRSAIRLDQSDDDARFNLELAHKLIRQLEQEQSGQQPQQNSSEQSDSGAKEKPESSEQSPDQSPQPNGETDQNHGESEAADQAEQDESNQSSQQPQDAGQQPDSAKPSEQSSDQQSSDQQSSDQQSGDKTSADSQRGDPPSGELTEEQDGAAPESPQEVPEGELTTSDPMQEDSAGAEQPQAGNVERLSMSQEEARKLLQAIRDRDLLRRLRVQAAQRARQIPVERDW